MFKNLLKHHLLQKSKGLYSQLKTSAYELHARSNDLLLSGTKLQAAMKLTRERTVCFQTICRLVLRWDLVCMLNRRSHRDKEHGTCIQGLQRASALSSLFAAHFGHGNYKLMRYIDEIAMKISKCTEKTLGQSAVRC